MNQGQTRNSATSWRLLLSGLTSGQHLLQVYEDPFSLPDAVSFFIRDGFSKGEAVLVVATQIHRGVLLRRLQENGHSPERFIAAGQLAFIDARALLREFMKDDMPDWDLFKEKVGGMIQKARAGTKNLKIRIYGEMVDVLSQRDNKAAALRLEEMWNNLASYYPFSLFCAYFEDHIRTDDGNFARQVSAKHTDRIFVGAVADA